MFYLDLFGALERHRVRYLLVGGLAMNLHGVPRMTMDVDLMLALDAENLHEFADVARELDLKPALPVSLASVDDMILLKEQAGRAQDISDIQHLKAERS